MSAHDDSVPYQRELTEEELMFVSGGIASSAKRLSGVVSSARSAGVISSAARAAGVVASAAS